jgi:hypothetical protein
MKPEDLLKEMKNTIGKKDPIEFFGKMVDMFGLLFNRLDQLAFDINKANIKATLAIQWEPKVAASMLSSMIEDLRDDKDTYFDEISKLKKAFVENKVTQNYSDFCKFWEETLGYHPFLNYKK